MPGGNVFKDHTFNKETAHNISRKQHNTPHEFSQYNTSTLILQNSRKQKIQKTPDRQAYSSSLHNLSYPYLLI
jgi:hypothetical protein